MRKSVIVGVISVSVGLGIAACSSQGVPVQEDGLRVYSSRVSQAEAEQTVKDWDNPNGTGCYRRACSIDRCYPDGTCDVTLSIPACNPDCSGSCMAQRQGDGVCNDFCSAMNCC